VPTTSNAKAGLVVLIPTFPPVIYTLPIVCVLDVKFKLSLVPWKLKRNRLDILFIQYHNKKKLEFKHKQNKTLINGK
jgi:hypothetical protein